MNLNQTDLHKGDARFISPFILLKFTEKNMEPSARVVPRRRWGCGAPRFVVVSWLINSNLVKKEETKSYIFLLSKSSSLWSMYNKIWLKVDEEVVFFFIYEGRYYQLGDPTESGFVATNRTVASVAVVVTKNLRFSLRQTSDPTFRGTVCRHIS